MLCPGTVSNVAVLKLIDANFYAQQHARNHFDAFLSVPTLYITLPVEMDFSIVIINVSNKPNPNLNFYTHSALTCCQEYTAVPIVLKLLDSLTHHYVMLQMETQLVKFGRTALLMLPLSVFHLGKPDLGFI